MLRRTVIGTLMLAGLTGALGCFLGNSQQPTGLAASVAGKAQEVVQRIGGPDGFGGPYLDGYYQHMGPHMGFHSGFYLADPDDDFVVDLTNESPFPCVFHLAYINSNDGLDQQVETIRVGAGETIEINLPCAEIIGIGSLTEVGAVAVEFDDGVAFDNRFCVPGFLNSDYACGGAYACNLAPDRDDLDDDGDTDELIVVTSPMQVHMRPGGMGSHMWDDGAWFGMMDDRGPGWPYASNER